MNIIYNEINLEWDFSSKQIDFFNYFVYQWCNAKKSKQGPEIWNQHKATTRTNNLSETNHSTMPSNIPRYHPLVSQITNYFKEQDAISSEKFFKLNNNSTSTQMKSSRKQKDFDYFLALTHEEYLLDDSNHNFQNEKREVFQDLRIISHTYNLNSGIN